MMMCQTNATAHATSSDAAASNDKLAGNQQITTIPMIDNQSTQLIHQTGNNENNINRSVVELKPSDHNDQIAITPNMKDQEIDQDNLDFFKPYNQMDSCDLNPDFAVICSFIVQFGEQIDMELDIEELKLSIEDQICLHNSLIDIHVKLLKKIRRYFVRDQWEKVLIRFVSEYSYESAYEIERLGYLKTRPSIKLELLRRLLDAQFECDQKFKAAVNLLEAENLRMVPTGRDIRGNSYWHRTDKQGNLRIFREEPLDYKTWNTVCSNAEDLNSLINELDVIKEEKVKGQPMTEPYNPLPEIFTELFLAENPQEELPQIDNATITKSKKSRRGKCKKTILPSIEEVENSCNSQLTEKENDYHRPQLKLEDNPVEVDNITTKPVESCSFYTVGFIESQVRWTLENLIDKVVSSFDYLIRTTPSASSNKPVEPKNPPKNLKRPKKEKKPKEEVLPRRSSSRIQQLQQKKIEEQKEQLTKKNDTKAIPPLDSDDLQGCESSDESLKSKKKPNKGQTWRRGKGKKKLPWDKDDSDLPSTSSLTDSNDDAEFHQLEDSFGPDNYDDEFACEDEDTNVEPVIIKRARTARQSTVQDDQGDDPSISLIADEDKPCGRCDKSNDPEWVLLCDMCDDGYHTSCCLPPLMMVPDGDWFCPSCEHKMLMTELRKIHSSITLILEAREKDRLKKQKLRQTKEDQSRPKPLAEKLPEKRQRDVIDELNDPIALQELDDPFSSSSDEEDTQESSVESSDSDDKSSNSSYRVSKKAKRKSNKRRKRPVKTFRPARSEFSVDRRRSKKTYSRRRQTDTKESDEVGLSESSESSKEVKPKTRRARTTVSYRFQEYDELIQSAIQVDIIDHGAENDEENDDKDEADSQDEGESNYGRGKDMATIEALAYQQENGFLERPIETTTADPGAVKKSRKRGRRLNDLDAASENENASSDESFQASSGSTEAEDDDITEVDTTETSDSSIDELIASRYGSRKSKKNNKKLSKRRISDDSDDSDYKLTRTTRRVASQQISYKESSEDDDTNSLPDPEQFAKKSKKRTLSSDEVSRASWESSSSSEDSDSSTSVDSQEQPKEKQADPVITTEISTVETKTEEIVPEIVSIKPVEEETLVTDKMQNQAQAVLNGKQKSKAKKIKLQPQLPSAILSAVNPPLDESIDELAAPLLEPKFLSTSDPQINSVYKPESETLKGIQTRDPIQELDHYCSESATSVNMFNSYNETLSKSSMVPQVHHPPFYEEDEAKSSPSKSDIKKKTKRSKKSDIQQSTDSSKLQLGKDLIPKNQTLPNSPLSKPEIVTPSAPSHLTNMSSSLHQQQAQPIPPVNPQPLRPNPVSYMMSPTRSFMPGSPKIYPPMHHSSQIPYATRTPYNPNKFNQQPPIQTQGPPSRIPSQMHPYLHSYDNPNSTPQFMQHSTSTVSNMNSYSTPPHSSGIWNTASGPLPPGAPNTRPSQMSSAYYPPPTVGMPNSNFSIHQILGNPYSTPSLNTMNPGLTPFSQMPNMSQPLTLPPSASMSSTLHNPLIIPVNNHLHHQTIQPGDANAGASPADTSEIKSSADKDQIMGMSDVISFIGDT